MGCVRCEYLVCTPNLPILPIIYISLGTPMSIVEAFAFKSAALKKAAFWRKAFYVFYFIIFVSKIGFHASFGCRS